MIGGAPRELRCGARWTRQGRPSPLNRGEKAMAPAARPLGSSPEGSMPSTNTHARTVSPADRRLTAPPPAPWAGEYLQCGQGHPARGRPDPRSGDERLGRCGELIGLYFESRQLHSRLTVHESPVTYTLAAPERLPVCAPPGRPAAAPANVQENARRPACSPVGLVERSVAPRQIGMICAPR